MFSPGERAMAPANLSSRKGIHFWAKGDGRTYRVMLFAQSKGMTPLTQTFVAGSEWKQIELPFTAFGTDGRDIMAIMFLGGPEPGPFTFQIDDIRIR